MEQRAEFFLNRLFQGWQRSGVQYAVMRNYEGLPSSIKGTDLDILINAADQELAVELLMSAIYDSGGCVVGSCTSRRFYKVVAYGRSPGRDAWWGACIDLFFGLVYNGNVDLLSDGQIKEISVIHNGIAVIPPGLAGVIGALKELLHNSKLPERYAVEAAEAFRVKPELIEQSLNPMGSRAQAFLRDLCVEDGEVSSLNRACRDLRTAVMVHAFRRAPLRFVCRRLSHDLSKVRRFLRPPGLMIAVLGADGAGKSTVIDAIAPLLDQATHGVFYRKHLRPGFLPALGRLRGNKMNGPPVTDPHASASAGWIGSLIRIVWLWLDYVVGYWFVVRPKVSKAPAVVLFDRYAPDVSLDPRRFRLGLPKKLLRLFPRIVPSPDIIICLHGHPEEVAARKNELPVQEVRRQTDALKDFAYKTPNAVLVSTEGSLEETTGAVLSTLRTFLLERDRGGR